MKNISNKILGILGITLIIFAFILYFCSGYLFLTIHGVKFLFIGIVFHIIGWKFCSLSKQNANEVKE